jgi:uncharacterized membrane protein YbhN (UPF0104 family)
MDARGESSDQGDARPKQADHGEAVTGAVATADLETPRRPHFKRLLIGAIVIVLIGGIAYLLGWDIRAWFSELWDTLTDISAQYLVAGAVLQTLSSVFKAIAWFWILRYAYPEGGVTFLQVLACYAASVALNAFLPANIGTFAMMVMFVAIIRGATYPGIIAAYLVQKIFFTVAGAVVYLYLFLSVPGSFDIKFEWFHDHPGLTAVILVGGAVLVALVVRLAWRWLKKLWNDAKQGGEVLRHPTAYMLRVFTPSFLGWSAGLGVIAVFLAAYGIPVTFHTVMSVVGGNSLANVTAVTPGSAGVTQAFNVISLNDVTDSSTAAAYSIGQQLFTTAWNILFGIVMMTWAFGWTGGRKLVEDSYTGAKEKAAEQSAARKAKRQAKREAKEGA